MTYVVTEPCRGCKHTECVTVCPCDSFYEGEEMLVIDPEKCIDCGACAAECPVEAIYRDEEVPTKWVSYIELNAVLAKQGVSITEKKG